DILRRQAIEPHDERAKRIAVGDDEDILAGLKLGGDTLLEKGHHTLGGVLQTLASGRSDVIRALPEMDLLGPPTAARLILVDADELAVVAFVQRRILHHRTVFLVELLENDIESVGGAFQRAGTGAIETKACRLEHGARPVCLEQPFFGEADILPSGEAI